MKTAVVNFGSDVRARDARAAYYTVTFISDFAFNTVSAVYVLFLINQGLDLFQVGLVNFAFMVGIFLLEVPTGAFADHFGRKKSIILSDIFIIFAFLTYFFSSTLLMFIAAEILAAVGYTFSSGALDAWLVDSLQEKELDGKIDFVFSRASIISKTASLFGGLIGAYIGSVSLRLPMGMGAVLQYLLYLPQYFY